MMPLTTVQRGLAVLVLAMGLISTGCNKKSDTQPKQKVEITIDPPQGDYDEDVYPIDRNRPVATGTTLLNDDGTEELIIPLREREPELLPVAPREKKVDLSGKVIRLEPTITS